MERRDKQGQGSPGGRGSRFRLLLLTAGGLALGCLALWFRQQWVPAESVMADLPVSELVALQRRHPHSEPILYTLGHRLEREGRKYEAVTAFEQASVEDRGSARSLDAAARILADDRQIHDAALHWEWALRIDPSRSGPRRGLVALYEGIQDWAAMERHLRWLIAHEEGDEATWYRLSNCLEQQGRKSEAMAALAQSAAMGKARRR